MNQRRTSRTDARSKAVGYIRCSTLGQATDGVSLDAQRSAITAWCQAHGYEVETEYASGSAKELLLPFADRWDTDLLVVGNSGKNLLRRKLFGETALQVIRAAKQAVFMSQ